eukprot:TRINITY_DN8609_c0_g1_i1.p1 TRINITY_DN8609_c0_g1~~TRINITY_DN8609_c0_g1_i1.p1  ORF type:complete len:205 (-),score=35.10 TRINITY_DN8609_c0_g1_i1:63-677(-)
MDMYIAEDVRTDTEKVNELFSLLSASNTAYFGEAITQLEHGLQCAKFAKDSGGSDSLILGALFHDVGHLEIPGFENHEKMEECGVLDHEHVGADYLVSLGFSTDVTLLIREHVKAKRYLTWRDKNYLNKLSETSIYTLQCQGGVMSDEEAHEFSLNPRMKDILRLRSFDEKAKVVGMKNMPKLEDFRVMALRHLKETRREEGAM